MKNSFTLIKRKLVLSSIIFFFVSYITEASEPWKVTVLDNPAPGYIKFDSNIKQYFFLLDNYGLPQYKDSTNITWDFTFFKLLSNGMWVCYRQNVYLLYDRNLKLCDSISIPEKYGQPNNHDILDLPNGHYIIMCETNKVMDLSKVVENGCPDATVIYCTLIETDCSGKIYWTWESLNHFSVTDATEDVELYQPYIDFDHPNSMALDNDGNLLVSFRHLDEITKIDINSGAVIWRLGGSKCKNNQFTFYDDEIDGFTGFSHQHSVSMLPNGNLLLFDNGNLKPVPYSRVVEYKLDQDEKTARKVWEYRYSPDLFLWSMGNVQRLPNGNTFINWVDSLLLEVRPDKSIAFKMELGEDRGIYRAFRYVTNMAAVTKDITAPGTFDFDDTYNQTDVILDIASMKTSGKLSVEKHYYAPAEVISSDTVYSQILPYRWVLSSSDISELTGTLKIRTGSLDVEKYNPEKLVLYKRDKEASGTFVPLKTIYSGSVHELSAVITAPGEIILCYYALQMPVIVSPKNNENGFENNGKLIWNPVKGASNYRLQVSTNDDFQNPLKDTLISNDTLYNLTKMEYGSKYYWRLRAINIKDTTAWTPTYSFTTKLETPLLLSPADQAVGVTPDMLLKWKIVKGALSYRVQIAEDFNFQRKVHDESNIVSLTHAIDNLESSSLYYWRISAINASDTSNWSRVRCFTTKITEPKLLSPDNEAAGQHSAGLMAWEAVNGAFSYNVRIAENSSFDPVYQDIYEITKPSYNYSELKDSRKYYWKVRALNSADTSNWSEARSFYTIAHVALKSPELLEPVNNSKGNDSTGVFRWQNVPEATSYSLQVSKSENFADCLIALNGLDSSSYVYREFDYGNSYYWRVKAYSSLDSSQWSETWVMSTKEISALPVVNLLIPTNGATQIPVQGRISWHEAPLAAGYELCVAENEYFAEPVINEKGIDSTYFDYKGLIHGKQYFWKVRYAAGNDTSQWSEVYHFTTGLPPELLSAPVSLDPADGTHKMPVNGILAWEPVEGADYYSLEISENDNYDPLSAENRKLTDNHYEYTGLNYNTRYYWHVAAFNSKDTSSWSEAAVFVTMLASPDAVSPAENADKVPVNGEIKWAIVDGAENYHFQLSEESGFTDLIADIKDNPDETYKYSLEGNRQYFWRVKAHSADNESDWSTFSFTTEDASVVEALTGIFDIDLMPNPAAYSTELQYSLVFPADVFITISDVTGKVINMYNPGLTSPGDHTFSLDIRHLNNGLYFISLKAGRVNRTIRMIVKK